MTLLSLVTAFLVLAVPGQKAETVLGYYISELRPTESDLASACYLFQGLPDAVVGVSFGYDARSKLDCERHLSLTLEKKSDGVDIPETLRFLAQRLYRDGKATVLVLRKEERATYANALRTQLAKPSLPDMDSDLARAMLCYLDFPTRAKGTFKHGAISKNVRSVLKTFKLEDRVKKRFERIGIFR